MIEDVRGCIDYDVTGAGPTIVLAPGSCSTGAAWRPLMAEWEDRFRCVTTSLLGYGGTEERRTTCDPYIAHEVDALELVVQKAGCPVHLVGHSFGGLVALALALRNRVSLASLVLVEAPAFELLRENGEQEHYLAIRRMTDGYFADFAGGNTQAIAVMIDFYGGVGTFTSLPLRAREYAVATTPINILDWASAYGFPLSAVSLAALKIPALVVWGGKTHPALQRANHLLSRCLGRAACAILEDAGHFMLATHAVQLARLISEHVHRADRGRKPTPDHARGHARTPDLTSRPRAAITGFFSAWSPPARAFPMRFCGHDGPLAPSRRLEPTGTFAWAIARLFRFAAVVASIVPARGSHVD